MRAACPRRSGRRSAPGFNDRISSMNAPVRVEQLLPQLDHTHLDWLEEEAIFILREAVAAFERPALLFSGGKDSCVVLRLAEKAFKTKQPDGSYKGRLPFPLLPVATA